MEHDRAIKEAWLRQKLLLEALGRVTREQSVGKQRDGLARSEAVQRANKLADLIDGLLLMLAGDEFREDPLLETWTALTAMSYTYLWSGDMWAYDQENSEPINLNLAQFASVRSLLRRLENQIELAHSLQRLSSSKK